MGRCRSCPLRLTKASRSNGYLTFRPRRRNHASRLAPPDLAGGEVMPRHLPVISVAELQEAVEAAEFGNISRPLDLYEGTSEARHDAEQRSYDLFGPNSEERHAMGYGYHEARYGEEL